MCSSLSEARHRDSRNWSSGADIEIAIARFAGCTVRVQVFDGQRFSVKSGIAVHGGALKIVAGGFNARSLIFHGNGIVRLAEQLARGETPRLCMENISWVRHWL